MCAVHGWDAPCRCGYAVCLAVLVLTGCAALSKVTPADRAAGYEAQASATHAACKAYRFDRATGLVADVPAMSELCGE